jgi:hypothetical protein
MAAYIIKYQVVHAGISFNRIGSVGINAVSEYEARWKFQASYISSDSKKYKIVSVVKTDSPVSEAY